MIMRGNLFIRRAVGMTIGSVPPNNGINCVRNVTFRDIVFHQPFKALYLKSNPGDSGSGIVENINYINIVINTPLWYPLWYVTRVSGVCVESLNHSSARAFLVNDSLVSLGGIILTRPLTTRFTALPRTPHPAHTGWDLNSSNSQGATAPTRAAASFTR
jgi:hypothetical protein